MKNLTKEFANKVYDVLVTHLRADERMRDDFIYHHVESKEGCHEYRFMGNLGFGGKYWSETNTVSCYLEDETQGRKELIKIANKELSLIEKDV